MAVLLVHCGLQSEMPFDALAVVLNAQRGVQLFFVISAFTLCLSLESRGEREQHVLRNFYIRRFFRLAPMFYLALIGNLIFCRTTTGEWLPKGMVWSDAGLALLGMHGIKPGIINTIVIGGWTVAVETNFYMVLPLLFMLIRNVRSAVMLLWISMVMCGSLSYLLGVAHNDIWEYFTFLYFPVEFPVFCMGILAYQLWRWITDLHLEARRRRRLSGWLMLMAGAIFVSSLPVSNEKLYWSSLAFVPFIVGCALADWKLIVNPVTVFMGKISYCVYLVHFFVLMGLYDGAQHFMVLGPNAYKGSVAGFFLLLVDVICITLPLAYGLHVAVEKPGIALGRRIVRRGEAFKEVRNGS